MPFRERVRRALNRSSGRSDSNSSADNKSSAPHCDPNVYQPGEKMPPLKYRRPVAKEHKELLEAFNFSKAWRRRSVHSIYSPMGSRLPSRRGSMISRKSIDRTSTTRRSTPMHQRATSIAHPVAEVTDDEEANVTNGTHFSSP